MQVDQQQCGEGVDIAIRGQLTLGLRLCQQLGQILLQLAIDTLDPLGQLLILLAQLHHGAGHQTGAAERLPHNPVEIGRKARQRARVVEQGAAQGAFALDIVIHRRQQQAALVAKGAVNAARVQAGGGHQLLHGGLGISLGAKRFHGISQYLVPIKLGYAHGSSRGKWFTGKGQQGPPIKSGWKGRQVYPSRPLGPTFLNAHSKKACT